MNSIVLLAGCSWACGEWKDHRTRNPWTPDVEHHGLAQYLRQDGYSVINLGQPAASNQKNLNHIRAWQTQNINQQVSNVLIFQTEYTRETTDDYLEDFATVTAAAELQQTWSHKFYQQLSKLSRQFGCPVTLIGGCSDTLDDDEVNKFPGLRIGCQSLVSLVLNQNPRVDTPVMSWYGDIAEPVVKKLKQKLDAKELSKFLDMIDIGHQRMDLVMKSREFFWPDGAHPNRLAHRVLYDHLTQQQML